MFSFADPNHQGRIFLHLSIFLDFLVADHIFRYLAGIDGLVLHHLQPGSHQSAVRFLHRIINYIGHPGHGPFELTGLRLHFRLQDTCAKQKGNHCRCRHTGSCQCKKPPGYPGGLWSCHRHLIALHICILQLPDKRLHSLGAILRLHIHSVHQRNLHGFGDLHPQPGGPFHLILRRTLHGILRRNAGKHLVKGRCQRIYIGPGSLIPVTAVLLLRRISLFNHHRQALAVLAGGITCRAEIKELHPQGIRLIGIQHIDIVRRNVPVKNSGPVYLLHGGSDLQNYREGLLHRHITVGLQIFL